MVHWPVTSHASVRHGSTTERERKKRGVSQRSERTERTEKISVARENNEMIKGETYQKQGASSCVFTYV